MTIYLALGSNQGDRAHSLERAIGLLQAHGFALERVSPVVESPALLPDRAPPEWNRPYLNLAVSGNADWGPRHGLAIAKQIEYQLGRRAGPRWSPRPIDIDLISWHGQQVREPGLHIPHRDAARRDFVLTPLLHLNPDLCLGDKTVFEHTRICPPIPLCMAIVNLTPDSFSGDGAWCDESALHRRLEALIERHIPIIDLGAESTRPRATVIDPQEEWRRLEPVLAWLRERLSGRMVRPWISLDSRHHTVVEQALDYGIDLLNDVSGLADADLLAVVKGAGLPVVSMHSLTVPADPQVLLSADRSAVLQVGDWIERLLERWAANGLERRQLILDPGIGFGKSAMQSLALLQSCRVLRDYGCRLLVGHSRKSFIASFTPPEQPASGPPGDVRAAAEAVDPDVETLAISMALCQQGVDIIRVHAALSHQRACRAWLHVGRACPPGAALEVPG